MKLFLMVEILVVEIVNSKSKKLDFKIKMINSPKDQLKITMFLVITPLNKLIF